jgi:hypothetical protein
LEIAGGADAIALVLGTTTAARLDLQTDSHHKFIQILESDGRFRLYNQTTNREQLTVSSGGNVGIGAASPSSLLEVAGADGTDGGELALTVLNGNVGNNDIIGKIVWKAPLENSPDGRLPGAAIWAEAQAGYTTSVNKTALFFGTGNSESALSNKRMTIDEDGNVGINCIPTTKFEVDTGAGSGNNVMIGQSSATNYNCISLNGSVTNTASQGLLGGADGGDLYIDTAGTTPTIYFRIGGATHMAIQNGGNVEIGTGSAEHLLEFKCSTHQSANDERIRFTNNGYNRGGLYTGSNTTPTPYLSSSSDYRLKKNIVDYGDGLLDKINSLKLRKWNPVEDENIECRGLVAHELAEIFPNYVMGEKDAVDDDGNPVYQSIGEGLLVLDLLGAIQELSAKVEALENA